MSRSHSRPPGDVVAYRQRRLPADRKGLTLIFDARYWLLVTGCWILVAGCWLLDTGCWLLVTGYWLLGAGYWLLVAGYWLLGAGYWLLVAGYWLPDAGWVPCCEANEEWVPANGVRGSSLRYEGQADLH